jgi:hypothetical protein
VAIVLFLTANVAPFSISFLWAGSRAHPTRSNFYCGTGRKAFNTLSVSRKFNLGDDRAWIHPVSALDALEQI